MRVLTSRWAPISGVAFVPLLVVGFGLVTSGPDTTKDPASKFVAFYSDSANRAHVLVGMYLIVFAAVAFAVFAAGLAARVRAAGGAPTLMIASAAAFSVLLGLAAAAMGWPAGDITFGGDQVANGDLLHHLPELGFPILLVPGAFAAAGFLLAAGLAGRERGVIPGWLSLLAIVAAVVVLFSVLFFPLLALPLWILAASVTLLVGRKPQPG